MTYEPYVYGQDKRADANVRSLHKKRCARCEIHEIRRKKRCYGCPSKGMKSIVLYRKSPLAE
jgi:hypothetical protein